MRTTNGNRVVSLIRNLAELSVLATQRRCPGCGAAVTPGLKFCTHCGQPLSAHPLERIAPA